MYYHFIYTYINYIFKIKIGNCISFKYNIMESELICFKLGRYCEYYLYYCL